MGLCGQCIMCLQNFLKVNFSSPKMVIIDTSTEEIDTYCLSVRLFDTSTESQSLKMTILNSEYQLCLHLFDQIYVTFFGVSSKQMLFYCCFVDCVNLFDVGQQNGRA